MIIFPTDRRNLVSLNTYSGAKQLLQNDKVNKCTCQADDHYQHTVIACLSRFGQSKINHTQQYRENVTSLLQQILTFNCVLLTLADISTVEELLYVLL